MRRYLNDDFFTDNYKISAIKKLMAAILERAIRDVESGNYKDARDALRWFLCTSTDTADCISFSTVSETLELSASRFRYIKRLLRSSDKRIESLRKLKKSDRQKAGQAVTSEQYRYRADGMLIRNTRRRS